MGDDSPPVSYATDTTAPLILFFAAWELPSLTQEITIASL